jgi:hypothetical protein
MAIDFSKIWIGPEMSPDGKAFKARPQEIPRTGFTEAVVHQVGEVHLHYINEHNMKVVITFPDLMHLYDTVRTLTAKARSHWHDDPYWVTFKQ